MFRTQPRAVGKIFRTEPWRVRKYSKLNLGGRENIQKLTREGGKIFRTKPGRVAR
jgi:hypothetical protein